MVSTSLDPANFEAVAGTILANYSVPTGSLSGPIGTITPAPVAIRLPPPSALLPSAVAAPVAPAPTGTTEPVMVNGAAAPVAPGQTPKDAADASDPILATVNVSEGNNPPPNAIRQVSASVEIVPGLLTAQRPLPPRSSDVLGLDRVFSGSGKQF